METKAIRLLATLVDNAAIQLETEDMKPRVDDHEFIDGRISAHEEYLKMFARRLVFEIDQTTRKGS